MRGTGIGVVSMSPIMNPQSRGATVRIFFRIINFFVHIHEFLASEYFGTNHVLQRPALNFFLDTISCYYFVYSNSTIIIKLTKPKTSYSLISKLSEVFEVTFFRISSKHYVGTGYIFLV